MVGGIAYLRTRRDRWDIFAHAGVEVGMVLATINVLTGMVYARAIINAWWTWDPKLTSVAIMVLTYASYLMLRNGVENITRRRIFASIYGIFAFMTVINTFLVIRIRPDALHEPMFAPNSGLFAMPEATQLALFANMAIWGLLIAPVLIAWRMRLENVLQERELRRLQVLSD